MLDYVSAVAALPGQVAHIDVVVRTTIFTGAPRRLTNAWGGLGLDIGSVASSIHVISLDLHGRRHGQRATSPPKWQSGSALRSLTA